MNKQKDLLDYNREQLTLTSNELVAVKFTMGMLLNHSFGLYQLPPEEVEEYKRQIISVVERIK